MSRFRTSVKVENDTRTTDSYYADGYNTGFEWLTKGWNFVHPAEIRGFANGRALSGYIPGGPIIFPDEKLYSRYGSNTDPFPHAANQAWLMGFITGINEYVVEKGLDDKIGFPILPPDTYVNERNKIRTNWETIKDILKEAAGK